MSSATETRPESGFIDRFEQLLEQGKREQASILGREVVKNANEISISEEGEYVVVETPNFRGQHEFVERESQRFVAEQGMYRYKSERYDFHFRVFTLNESAKKHIYPEELLRGGGRGQGAVDTDTAIGSTKGNSGLLSRILKLVSDIFQ